MNTYKATSIKEIIAIEKGKYISVGALVTFKKVKQGFTNEGHVDYLNNMSRIKVGRITLW